MLGVVFRKAQNRIQDPAKLRRLIVDLIDREQWMTLDADVKGDAYEGLLEKNAEDVKSGAGQYFTPRPLIRGDRRGDAARAGDDDLRPGVRHRRVPARGVRVDRAELTVPRPRREASISAYDALKGWEIVDNTARLCVMNLLLHGIGAEDAREPDRRRRRAQGRPRRALRHGADESAVRPKSSMTFVNAEGEAEREDLVVVRDDFWASTSNKQLNFVQHVKTLLAINGRAAIVVPDNVLFEGGAGETVRRKLLDECDVHTLLRLPTGIFYAQGVKANVLFFDRKPASETPWTKELWVYDLRTNQHFTLKQNPLRHEHLDDFVAAYKPETAHEREESERFQRFTYDELLAARQGSLDIIWLRDESLEDTDNLPPPEVIAQEIVEDLEAALAEFSQIAASLGQRDAE